MPPETHSPETTTPSFPEKDHRIMLASIKEYNKKEMKEMLGQTNMYFAGKELGHTPTDEEAMDHYIENGGANHFAEIYAHPD